MNDKPMTNTVSGKAGKQSYKVWPVGMTGRVALILFFFTLLPMVFTCIMIEKGMLLPGKNLYILLPVFFTILIHPVSKMIAHYLVNRDLKMINAFCSRIKEGYHDVDFNLPNQKEEEDYLIALLRNMNWMNHNLEVRHLRSAETLSKTRQEYKEMKKEASTDPLTGLYNRRYLELTCWDERRNFSINNNSASLIYIDCDRFKQVNDTLGHKTGDKLLVCLADCIRKNIRESQDVPARLGGDEFAVLLPSADDNLAGIIAKRIRNLYNAHKIGDTSLSIGIATAKDVNKMSIALLESLIHGADEQVYKAKHAGGDTIFADLILPDSVKLAGEYSKQT